MDNTPLTPQNFIGSLVTDHADELKEELSKDLTMLRNKSHFSCFQMKHTTFGNERENSYAQIYIYKMHAHKET